MRLLYVCLLSFALLFPAHSAEAPKAASANEVAGLKLPEPKSVEYDEGFVTLEAECKGTVQWLVLSTSVKVKYKVNKSTPNEIDIAIPPYESLITVYAVGLVDSKLTAFARTDINVKGPPVPQPPEPPPAPGPDVKTPLHLSIIEDPAARTPAINNIINSTELRNKLKAKKVNVRVYSKNDEEIKNKKFDAVLAKYNTPIIILQDATGKGLVIGELPKDLPSVYKLINPYVGGGL